MSFRSPLAKARGLGSAKDGTGHWWAQRLTATALVPLTIWFVSGIVALVGADRPQVIEWVSDPVSAVLLVVLLGATFHHGQLGLQVVIEDYVHSEGLKIALIILVKFAAVLLALASIFAVLRIAFGGA